MATLMDIIQRNVAGAAGQPAATDDTIRAQKLMQARSGKQVAPAAAALSNVSEQAARADATSKLENVREKATTLAARLGEGQRQQDVRQSLGEAEIGLTGQAQDQSFQQRLSTIAQKSDQESKQLDMEQAKAGAEQRAFQRAFANKSYLDTLKREGDKRRLNDELEFKRQLSSNALGNNEQLLRQLLGQKEVLAADERTWREFVAQIDLATAMDTAKNAMADARTKQYFESAATLGQAGIDIYANSNKNKSNSPKGEG